MLHVCVCVYLPMGVHAHMFKSVLVEGSAVLLGLSPPYMLWQDLSREPRARRLNYSSCLAPLRLLSPACEQCGFLGGSPTMPVQHCVGASDPNSGPQVFAARTLSLLRFCFSNCFCFLETGSHCRVQAGLGLK